MSWFLAFAGFAALIILHEAGHFVAAKATGMRVERFFLFFPPRLWSVKRGETEYGVGAIPLGGFVKITGMNPEEELPPEIAHRGYYRQPVWKRIVTIAAGPAVNLAIAFVLLFVLAFGITEPTEVAVGDVETGTPASHALQKGDVILAVDGYRGGNAQLDHRVDRFLELTDSHRCARGPSEGCRAATPVRLTVLRDGERRHLNVRPFYDEALERNRLGLSFEGARFEALDPSPGEAAGLSAEFMWRVTSATASTFAQILEAEKREQLSGVIGSYEVTRQAIEFDARRALTLLAVISLSLGLINLFPFLPLDGGHIFWSVVEKVRGRPVAFRTMERASVIGFVLVLFIFVIGLSNDIGRLTGDGFEVR